VHSPELAPEAAEQGYGLYLWRPHPWRPGLLPGGIPVLTHMDRAAAACRGAWRAAAGGSATWSA